MVIKRSKYFIFAAICAILIALAIALPYAFSSTVNGDDFFDNEAPIIVDEDKKDDNQGSNDSQTPSTGDETTEIVPIYTNGNTCLFDAMDKLMSQENFKTTCSSTIMAMGVTQKLFETKEKNGNYYMEELKAYGKSSFTRTDYRKYESFDGQNFTHYFTDNINEKLEVDESTIQQESITYDEILAFDKNIFEVMSMPPTRTNGTVSKFDRMTNKDYYIIDFIFDVDNIDEEYVQAIIREGKLSDAKVLSLKTTVYVSKATGRIKSMQKNEIYKASIGPLSAETYAKYVVNFY